MPDTSASQSVLPTLVPVGILVFAALGVFVAAAGVIYWALHNLGRDLREEMQRQNQLLLDTLRAEMNSGFHLLQDTLRAEMNSGFRRLEDLLMRHQHDADGFPVVRLRQVDDD
jgi:hypothetical protein